MAQLPGRDPGVAAGRARRRAPEATRVGRWQVLRSLRFRLPALFLIGIVLSGVVAAATAIGLFQDYVEDRTRAELRRNAAGVARLYAEQAIATLDEDRSPAPFIAKELERASGNRLFYVGPGIYPGLTGSSVLPELPQSVVPQWRTGQGANLRVHAAGARTRPSLPSHTRCGCAACSTAPWSWRLRRISFASAG